MEEIAVGKLTDIADGDYRIFAVEELEVGIFRNGSKVLAYENVCPHAGGPVCQGKIFNQVEEVITSGTPAMPHALNFAPFGEGEFVHRVSPGTIVYNDRNSLLELPDHGFLPAALVLSTVVSRPRANRVTCDAGHKAVSADAGVPTCEALGWPGLTGLKPSEEHLPIEVTDGAIPARGEMLYLLPTHVCPTVNNFDRAMIIRDGEVESIEPVTARGREVFLSRSVVGAK